MLNLLGYSDKPVDKTAQDAEGLPKDFRVGVEVELEGIGFLPFKLKHWNQKSDDSLKDNGVELVFKEPKAGTSILSALDELKQVFALKPRATSRTSIHIHVDVIDMEFRQFINLLKTYVILEKILYRLGGFERYSNNNCLPVSTNIDFIKTVDLLERNVGNDNNILRILNQSNKYSGCNLLSVVMFDENEPRFNDKLKNVVRRGSLEFRMHEGTTDSERILNWIRVLLKLKTYSMNNNIEDIINSFSMMGGMPFISNVFQDMTPYIVDNINIPDYQIEHELYEGVRNLQFIVHINQLDLISKEYVDHCNSVLNADYEDRGPELEVEEADDIEEMLDDMDNEPRDPEIVGHRDRLILRADIAQFNPVLMNVIDDRE